MMVTPISINQNGRRTDRDGRVLILQTENRLPTLRFDCYRLHQLFSIPTGLLYIGRENQQVIEAKTPQAVLGVEGEDARIDSRCVFVSQILMLLGYMLCTEIDRPLTLILHLLYLL